MAQRRYYRVGGHLFAVTAAEQVFALMSNYQPFEVAEASSPAVFDLHVGADHPVDGYTHFFTSTSDDDMPRIEIYRKGEEWLFELSQTKNSDICIRITASADLRTAQLSFAGDVTRFGIDNACMLLYAFTTLYRQTLLMHAAVVGRQGKGYLFLGHSGTGKSTHARLWQQAFNDAWLLNDDNPVVRLQEDGTVLVYGSPWSGKTPCYINRQLPVGAIVQLARAPHNAIRPMRLAHAYAYMLSSVSGLKFMPEMMDALYDTIARVIQTVPTYYLECLPDTAAASTCASVVTSA